MLKNSSGPPAPDDLQAPGRALWESTVREFQLEAHHLVILHSAARQLDIATEARAFLGQDGLFIQNRAGKLIEHPAAASERAAMRLFRNLMRELGLDIEPADDGYSRPPALSKHGRGRV